MIALTLAGAEVKFTPDQCRVLRQMGIDTTGICPPAKPPPQAEKQDKPK